MVVPAGQYTAVDTDDFEDAEDGIFNGARRPPVQGACCP